MTCDKKKAIVWSGIASPIVAMRKEENEKYTRKDNENCNSLCSYGSNLEISQYDHSQGGLVRWSSDLIALASK